MNFGGIFDLEAKEEELNKKRHLTTNENFWNDNKVASLELKKISALEKEINLWKKLDSSRSDCDILIKFFESDEVSLHEVEDELLNLYQQIENHTIFDFTHFTNSN